MKILNIREVGHSYAENMFVFGGGKNQIERMAMPIIVVENAATLLRPARVSACNLWIVSLILVLLLLPGCSPARVQEGYRILSMGPSDPAMNLNRRPSSWDRMLRPWV